MEIGNLRELVTHDGKFHADDVLCFALLRARARAKGAEPVLIRTRDPEWTKAAPGRIVFDVGRVLSPTEGLLDHHQRDRLLRGDGTPYSAFGLAWMLFGRDFVRSLAPRSDDVVAERAWGVLDAGLVLEVDAFDNGASSAPQQAGHLSRLVEALNPPGPSTDEQRTTSFVEAADACHLLLRGAVVQAIQECEAIEVIRSAAARREVPEILVLDDKLSIGEAIHDLGLDDVLYVVSPRGDGEWSCYAVPPERGSMAQRLPLPEAWGGLEGQLLARECGVKDAVFCHPSLFVCAAGSRHGALSLARAAIALPRQSKHRETLGYDS